VYLHIDTHVADQLFFGTGRTHDEVLDEIKANLKPASLALGKTATITADANRHPEGRAANVIGIIEGSDPVLKDEVIIVGGHLDGVGYLGDVFAGALDNASGIADILGAARALAISPVRPKRSILFLFIGGEECGLIGSTLYTEHPVFPRDKTVVFFNLDMVGHGTGLRVGGGLTYPQIYRHFEAANEAYLHRAIRTSESRPSVGRPRSDGVIFQRAGFRTMSVGTLGRVPGMSVYYHDPRDTPETLTPEIMEDVAKLLFVGLTNLANDTTLRF
jgi:Zn-dependent M28 family amino/carboxypeptidase